MTRGCCVILVVMSLLVPASAAADMTLVKVELNYSLEAGLSFERPRTQGTLDRRIVERLLTAWRLELETCLEPAAQSATLCVEFTVTGCTLIVIVTQVTPLSSEVDEEAIRCLTGVLEGRKR